MSDKKKKKAAQTDLPKEAPATDSEPENISPREASGSEWDRSPVSPHSPVAGAGSWVVVDEKDKENKPSASPSAESKETTETKDSAAASEDDIDDSKYPPVDLSEFDVTVTEDGQLRKKVLRAGDGDTPVIMSRVYVLIKGTLPDGTVFLDSTTEEFDFLIGRGEVAVGLQMVMPETKVGEQIKVYCGKKYGYNDGRRPSNVPKGAPLVFEVELRRWEKEKNLHEMSVQDKVEYLKQRREVGKTLFSEGRIQSALKQYSKALEIIGLGMDPDGDADPALKGTINELWLVHLLNASLCKIKTKEYNSAIEMCTKALTLDRKNVKALARRAEAFHRNREYDEALEGYKKVLELSDDQKLTEKVKEEMANASQSLRAEQRQKSKEYSKMFSQEIYDDKPMPPPTLEDRVGRTTRWFTNPCRQIVQKLRSLCGKSVKKQQ